MGKIYERFRTIITCLFVVVLGIVCGAFAIDHTHPTDRLSILLFIRQLPCFWPTIAALGGFVGGMWVDSFMVQRIRSHDLVLFYDEASKSHGPLLTGKRPA